jgi:1-aminocyclopropane-1-carboxylate deaminase/D-cysteine desulfhydrase-like pyridoxal-dependent ACC family enzyme
LIERIAKRVRQAGKTPMVLTSEPIFDIGSALAYLECTAELIEQMEAFQARPDYIYMTSGGKGQAGLVLAQRLLQGDFKVHGVTVSYEYEVGPRTARIANDTAQLLGLDMTIGPEEVISYSDHVGEGYGHLTDEALEAMALMARTQGVILDPIYTGKCFAALLDHIRTGVIEKEATVVFVHTGGTPALFAYHEELTAGIAARTRGAALDKRHYRNGCAVR